MKYLNLTLTVVTILSVLTTQSAHADVSGGARRNSDSSACPHGKHLECAPHLAGGCNNKICVNDRTPPTLTERCEDSSFVVVGSQKNGKTCAPDVFYPECARTKEQDALVHARKECYPSTPKRLTPWTVVNAEQSEASFTCCILE